MKHLLFLLVTAMTSLSTFGETKHFSINSREKENIITEIILNKLDSEGYIVLPEVIVQDTLNNKKSDYQKYWEEKNGSLDEIMHDTVQEFDDLYYLPSKDKKKISHQIKKDTIEEKEVIVNNYYHYDEFYYRDILRPFFHPTLYFSWKYYTPYYGWRDSFYYDWYFPYYSWRWEFPRYYAYKTHYTYNHRGYSSNYTRPPRAQEQQRTNPQNRPLYQQVKQSYTPSYSHPRMEVKPNYNNTRPFRPDVIPNHRDVNTSTNHGYTPPNRPYSDVNRNVGNRNQVNRGNPNGRTNNNGGHNNARGSNNGGSARR